MLSPNKFAKQIKISYDRALIMCSQNEIENIKTEGGHYLIPEKEVDKFISNENFVSREDYESVIRENAKLKTLLDQVKSFIINLKFE